MEANLRDIGAYIDPKEALHAEDFDGSSDENGNIIDIRPAPDQDFQSALLYIRLRDAAADETVDFTLEHSTASDMSGAAELVDVGTVDWDVSESTGSAIVKVDLEIADQYLRLTALQNSGSDTDVSGSDLNIDAVLVLGGAAKIPLN
jgi:hypothetical protein